MERMMKGVGKIIAEELGKEKAGTIAQKSQLRFEELIKENCSDSKVLKRHTYKRIYPAIALYETMVSEGIDDKRAVWYIREYYQRFASKIEDVIRGCLKVPGLYHKIPGFMGKIVVKESPEEAGFEYRWPEKQRDGEIRFDIIKCPYAAVCERYGHPELTHVFCDGDDAGYGNMHPNLKWGRTKTLGRGGDCCNFKLTDTSKM